MNTNFTLSKLTQNRKKSSDSSGLAVAFDSASFTDAQIALESAAVIEQWAETDDLDDGETLADRLANMIVGIANEDADGELTDDDQDVIEDAMEAAGDFLAGYGVDEADIDLLLNERDNDAAERVQDLLQAEMADMDGAGCDKKLSGDDLAFDATYKKQRVIRDGKAKWVRKRVSGTVRMSAKQKLALKKARRKAHSSAAKMKRKKSNRRRN